MRALLWRAALSALLLPVSARAQSLVLTEADALARLSPASPRVRAIRAQVDVARAAVAAAALWPNPRLSFDRESVSGVTENLTMISQPLPITGRRRLDIQAATAVASASQFRADDDIKRARADLRLAFAELVASQIRERELTRTRDRLRALVDVLAAREKAGDAAGFDHLRVEREVLDVEADRSAATTVRASAQARLASLFADSLSAAALVAVETPAPRVELPPVQALVERAERTRGELLALRQDADAARFAERAAARRRVPEPEIAAGTKTSTVNGGDVGSVVTFQASLPLFDHGQAERALARARAGQAQAREQVLRGGLQAEIAAWRAAVIERRQTADQYRDRAVKGADELERIAQVSYEAGERGILELLDAFRAGSSARVRQGALDAAVRAAEIELELVSGWEVS